MKILAIAIVFFAATARAAEPPPYLTVNEKPQFTLQSDGHFGFYWAVWRGLRADERRLTSRFQPRTFVVSQRKLVWTTGDCDGAAPVIGSETYYFLDSLRVDENDRLLPIPEAPLTGYRHFVLANFRTNPLQARARGTLSIRARHRFYFLGGRDADQLYRDFRTLRDRQTDDDGIFWPPNPDASPVFFDERAHKAHADTEPTVWKSGQASSEDAFAADLVWDGCAQPPSHVFYVAPGSLPPPGPNRPGRTDGGSHALRFIEKPLAP